MTKLLKLSCLIAVLAQTSHLIAMDFNEFEKNLSFSYTYTPSTPVLDIINHATWNETKKVDELKKLFEKEIYDINAHYFGLAALHYASNHGELEIIKFLLEKTGANINERCAPTGYTPLQCAILTGNIGVAKFLIEKGAKLEKVTFAGQTAINLAAQNGYAELVELLISKKVKIQQQDVKKSTPLHSAALFGHKKILELLILNGIDHMVKNIKGQTALNIAKVGYDNLELFKNIKIELMAKGTKFYEDQKDTLKTIGTVLKENLSANIAYLTLVEDFYSYLKIMREGAQMFGKIFENQFITETFASFANTYFTGENGGQNFTDVQKLLPLDKDKYFTKSFNTWCKNNTTFGASAGSTITAQPTTLTPNGLTNTNLCATMGNLSITKK